MVGYDFFNRLSAYPVVASACQQASAGLTWAKDRSAYAKSAADLAESGLRRAAKSASPLLARYEERATGLDRLACRQLLDRLEAACPTVLEPTDKVVERGREYYSSAVKPKVDLLLSPVSVAAATAESVKSASLDGYRRAVSSRLSQSSLHNFDRLIELIGDCADRYLPPGPDEKQKPSGKAKDSAASEQSEDKEEKKTDEAVGNDVECDDEPSREPADPVRSLAMAFDLGRRLGLRATDRMADAGHRLYGRLTRRSDKDSDNSRAGDSSEPTASSSSAASDASTAKNSSSRRRTDKQEAGGFDEVDEDDNQDESALDRSDMSTD